VDICLNSFDIINAAKKYSGVARNDPNKILACTTIVLNQSSHAHSLAASIATCHQDALLAVLLVSNIDAEQVQATFKTETNIIVFSPEDIGIKKADLHKLALFVGGKDLAAKLAPSFALFILSLRDSLPLVILSPETAVISSLDPLLRHLDTNEIALVPWQSSCSGHSFEEKESTNFFSAEYDGRLPDELDVDLSGAFNPSIVAVKGQKGMEFLTWWQRAIKRNLAAPEPLQFSAGSMDSAADGVHLTSRTWHLLPYAQPFLDQTLPLFSPTVVQDIGCGLGFWNVHQRELTQSADGVFMAGTENLYLVDFAGFDPYKPYLLSTATAHHPRALLSENKTLRLLCGGQADRLVGGAYLSTVNDHYLTKFYDGTTMDERMRRLLQRALLEEGFDNLLVGDPFEQDGLDEFYAFLASADPKRHNGPMVPGYLLEIYEERKDLALNFPRLTTVDALPYRNWVAFHGVDEEVPSLRLREILAETPWWKSPTSVSTAGVDGLRPGVTLTGYLKAEVGVGEAARLVLDALVGARIEVSPVVVDLPTSRQNHPFNSPAQIADRKINIIWMNAEHLLGFAALVGPSFFEGRYSVGGWAWETENIPLHMAKNSDLLDEIWVPSGYVRDAVEPYAECPVYVFPHPIVEPPIDREFELENLVAAEINTKRHSGKPDLSSIKSRFKFLYTFDFNSSLQRKNPFGVIEAFKKAFGENEGPLLILKSINGYKWQMDLERLKNAAIGREDILIIDKYLSSGERGALLNQCDCYVSLHRAEGFGLGMAEAMALGKPVVATKYSGNLEFMDQSCAWLVNAEKVRVGTLAPPYQPDDYWAEPDLDEAAQYLREVLSDPQGSRIKADRAKTKVLAEHGRAKAIRFLSARIDEIAKLEEAGYSSSAAAALRKHLN